MSVVYLLRHGQASFGAADYDVLSPVGQQQAKVLGEELRTRGVEPAQVWAGTLSRQRDTAAITLAALGVDSDLGTDPRWNEYDHIGLVAALATREHIEPPSSPRDFQAILDRALHEWISNGRSAGHTGSYADFADDALAALTEAGGGGPAVAFTSGGVIAAICSRITGADFVKLNRVVVNAAITKIVVGRSGASVVSFNEHGHFEGANRDLLTYR